MAVCDGWGWNWAQWGVSHPGHEWSTGPRLKGSIKQRAGVWYASLYTSLCLSGLGTMEHGQNSQPWTHRHRNCTHREHTKKEGSHAHLFNPSSTKTAAHTLQVHLIFLRFNMSQVFSPRLRKSRQINTFEKKSLCWKMPFLSLTIHFGASIFFSAAEVLERWRDWCSNSSFTK